jgi:GNAT superfamily N-acetyltransferase
MPNGNAGPPPERITVVGDGQDTTFEIVDEHTEGGGAYLARFHREILAASFSPQEYAPPDDPESAEGPWLVLLDADGTVVGGALADSFPESNTLLVSYVATRGEWRGKLVGSHVLSAMRERWFGPDTFAIGEVEDPRHHAADAEFGDPVARLRFYERFGVELLAMPYFQPSLQKGLPRAYHLILAVLTAPASMRVGDGISGGRIGKFLQEYFTACEGPEALDDPELQWLLRWCDSDHISLVPISELSRVPQDEPPGATPA